MIVEIHYTLPNGDEDYVVLTGDIEEIREEAAHQVEIRSATDPWSCVIEEYK